MLKRIKRLTIQRSNLHQILKWMILSRLYLKKKMKDMSPQSRSPKRYVWVLLIFVWTLNKTQGSKKEARSCHLSKSILVMLWVFIAHFKTLKSRDWRMKIMLQIFNSSVNSKELHSILASQKVMMERLL